MTLYDTIGSGYAAYRKPERRIASAIDEALGDAATVVNVGAGSGSYEPRGRSVLAVEPSEVMIRQRPAEAAPCVRGCAEALPLATGSVDAAMAILSVHHWADLEQGLREMRRVARRRAVVLTWVPDAPEFWLTDEYFPEIAEHDRAIFPRAAALKALIERMIGPARIAPVPVPHDCTDGFLGAYWRRPELYLDAERRNSISSFARIDCGPGLARLRSDLESGRWANEHRELLALNEIDLGYRLVTSEMAVSNAKQFDSDLPSDPSARYGPHLDGLSC